MALLVPVARDKNGVMVLPSCEKTQGPFKCVECSERLVVRQGGVNRWHFAHMGTDAAGCSGGGESLRQLAAKLIVTKYIKIINFVQLCPSGQHKHERQYELCATSEDIDYDGRHSSDVAIAQDGELRAVIEVKVCHATTGAALELRVCRVGVENMWVVDTMKVLRSQCELHYAKGNIDFEAANNTECGPCEVEREKERVEREAEYEAGREERDEAARLREAEYEAERVERGKARATRDTERSATKRKASWLSAQGTPGDTNTIEIIDSMTVRRNGVLLKKKYLEGADKGPYSWFKAEDVMVLSDVDMDA